MHSIDTDAVPPTQLFSDKEGHGKVRLKNGNLPPSKLRGAVPRSIKHETIIGRGLTAVSVAFIATLLRVSGLPLEAGKFFPYC